jgi:hypothetical protein
MRNKSARTWPGLDTAACVDFSPYETKADADDLYSAPATAQSQPSRFRFFCDTFVTRGT